jgi:hypothetical protein
MNVSLLYILFMGYPTGIMAKRDGFAEEKQDQRARQILAEAVERMKAEKIHPTAIFLALLELVAIFAACEGEEQAFALAIRDIESYAQKWSAAHEKQKHPRN